MGKCKVCGGMEQNAKNWVETTLRSSLPEGVPLPFKQIITAIFVGSGRKKSAIGTLLMVDGLTAKIEVSKWADFADAWSYRWLDLAGGSLNWNGSSWERIDETEMFDIYRVADIG